MHNSYAYDEAKVDVSVFRREAQLRAFDDRSPDDTVIHLHPWDENGDLCDGDPEKHEYYKVGEGKVDGPKTASVDRSRRQEPSA